MKCSCLILMRCCLEARQPYPLSAGFGSWSPVAEICPDSLSLLMITEFSNSLQFYGEKHSSTFELCHSHSGKPCLIWDALFFYTQLCYSDVTCLTRWVFDDFFAPFFTIKFNILPVW